MSVMFVGAASAAEKSRCFLFIATSTRGVLAFLEHVQSKLLHGLVVPNFCQGLLFAVAYRVRHLGMTARVGFTSGIGMQMYPGINAECAAFSQEITLTVRELLYCYLDRLTAVVVVGHCTRVPGWEMCH